MAETNELLLNFAIEDEPLNFEPLYKGGRWKDRVRAKHISRLRQHKRPPQAAEPSGVLGNQQTQHGDAQKRAEDVTGKVDALLRPTKRKKVEKGLQVAESGDSANGAGGIVDNNASGPRSLPAREVVSSLFSNNPVPQTRAEDNVGNISAVKPSNAPLEDEGASFTALGLSSTLSTHLLRKMGLETPTGIQTVAIPQLLAGDSDTFIQAQTGSGKTLAYLLPMVQRIMTISGGIAPNGGKEQVSKLQRGSGLFAIVLTPTRELSRQILVVLERLLGCAHWIVPGSVLGGEKKKSEKARIRKGLNILVATPGRLSDHLENTEMLDVSQVRWLVLDEGDRLTELGFEEEIQAIASKLDERSQLSQTHDFPSSGLPSRRVTILCSATMKTHVQRLGEISLKDAIHIKADPTEGEVLNGTTDTGQLEKGVFSAPAQLKQVYTICPAKQRLVTLAAILRKSFRRRGTVMKAIVFLSCADSVDFHFEVFGIESITDKDKEQSKDDTEDRDCTNPKTITEAIQLSSAENQVTIHRLHGSLPQEVRTTTLAAFASNPDPSVLVCTDVASRGLDLPNIDFVIEYDPPFSKDDHLHRIGRTARAGRAGQSLIFLLPGNEEGYVDILRSAYQDGGERLARNDPIQSMKRGFGSAGIGAGKDWEERATKWQLEVERWVSENPTHLEMARRAFQSHVRAYATHVAAERSIFDIKTLHLGHLAKSFGLRDKPGSISVPGLPLGMGVSNSSKKEKRSVVSQEGTSKKRGSDGPVAELVTLKQAMKRKMQEHMNEISEFNIG